MSMPLPGVIALALLLAACASSAPSRDAARDAQSENSSRVETAPQVGGGSGM